MDYEALSCGGHLHRASHRARWRLFDVLTPAIFFPPENEWTNTRHHLHCKHPLYSRLSKLPIFLHIKRALFDQNSCPVQCRYLKASLNILFFYSLMRSKSPECGAKDGTHLFLSLHDITKAFLTILTATGEEREAQICMQLLYRVKLPWKRQLEVKQLTFKAPRHLGTPTPPSVPLPSDVWFKLCGGWWSLYYSNVCMDSWAASLCTWVICIQ